MGEYNTIQCNGIIIWSIFFKKTHNRHPIPCLWGQDMGCSCEYSCENSYSCFASVIAVLLRISLLNQIHSFLVNIIAELQNGLHVRIDEMCAFQAHSKPITCEKSWDISIRDLKKAFIHNVHSLMFVQSLHSHHVHDQQEHLKNTMP